MMRFILLLLCLFTGEGLEAPPIPTLNSSKVYIVQESPIPFSPENLWCYILDSGIIHPEIAYAQAVLETGNFTSKIFRKNHNLFGMKLAKVRETTATGERFGHATYCNWKDSVKDYLLWQQMWQRTPIETEYQYYELLDRLYAEDPRYVEVVKIVRERNYEWNI